jgi:sterol desaturase/sphingolipid hydroxylase (fatty acid hydroxylase superfamily)
VKEFYSNFPLFALQSLPRLGISVAAACAVFLLDWLQRPRPTHLRFRPCLHDLLYYLFYNSILNIAFLVIPARRLLLPILRLSNWQILATLPVFPRFVIFFIVADFMAYWQHRTMHTRFLWAFHAVHHEQTQLTTFTSARKHVVEGVSTALLLLVLTAVLGNPARDALWFYILLVLKDATLHSGLRWRYGPFYWVLVSPLFHSVHHSTEVEVSNTNFGAFFSFWDMLFGTYYPTTSAPDRQGVVGLTMPTLWSQFWMPWKMAWENIRGRCPYRAESLEGSISSE